VFIGEDIDAVFGDASGPIASDNMMKFVYSTNRYSARSSAVPLKIVAGSLKAQSAGLSFHCRGDGETIDCEVAGEVLHDLLAFHRFEGRGDDAVRALLPEIERLANIKRDAGRFDEDGTLVIRPADLLRYGFQAKSAAAKATAANSLAPKSPASRSAA